MASVEQTTSAGQSIKNSIYVFLRIVPQPPFGQRGADNVRRTEHKKFYLCFPSYSSPAALPVIQVHVIEISENSEAIVFRKRKAFGEISAENNLPGHTHTQLPQTPPPHSTIRNIIIDQSRYRSVVHECMEYEENTRNWKRKIV